MGKKGFLHGLLMMACIVPMLALVAFLPQIKNATSSGFNWSWLFLLACPLIHILIMKGMHSNEESCHGSEKEAKQTKDKTDLTGKQAR